MADVDAVVIGSGAGGLTAAVGLAQSGMKVVVLEQHDVPGGWCHSFTLEGYRFSPGVHYIGEMHPGGRMREVYEGLGVANDLVFCELNPDGYDHILAGRQRFSIPRGRERFAEQLKARFPHERKGIDGYLDTVAKLGRELDGLGHLDGLRDLATLPLRMRTVARWGLFSAQSMINHFVRDPMVRAVFAGQAGDHGLPPSLSPAPVHASVTAHYFKGGYYPRGGAFVLPRAFVRALKRAGGEIRLKTSVERILLEGRKAVGVKLADGTEIRAKHVISNADPDVTFRKLIGVEKLSPLLRRKLDRTRYSVSALSLFMAVDMDVRAAGLDSGNVWYYQDTDVDAVYRHGMTNWGLETQQIPGQFLTVTTLKDPTKKQKGHHTMESFAFVGYDSFRRWAHTNNGNRPADYAEMKKHLLEKMLNGIERFVPGLKKHVVFADLATPLTNVHYCAATRGNLYGIEKSLRQVGPFAYPIKSEFDGLTLCGSSTISHGVLGATISGLFAAQHILKCRSSDLLRARGQQIRSYPSEDLGAWPESFRPHTVRHTIDAEVDVDVDAPTGTNSAEELAGG
jgi:phytoene dehydrogenase-like protein